MLKNSFWNESEQRIRAGWRIVIQILMVAIPLAGLGLSGFYSTGNFPLRMALTAGPVTVLSVIICSRFIDKRRLSDLGIRLEEKIWWRDYGFGILIGFLSASFLVLMLKLLGWGEVVVTRQWRYGFWSFMGSFLVGLISYLIVGIFEELMRAYQIKNVAEGLAAIKLRLTWTAVLAVLAGGIWSTVAHISSFNPSFLIFILITAVIYGLYFLLTGRVALAMGAHFAWDFALSAIFQLGSTSETSFYYILLGEMPDLAFEITSLLGIAAKMVGLLTVMLWVWKQEGRLQIKSWLSSYSLHERILNF